MIRVLAEAARNIRNVAWVKIEYIKYTAICFLWEQIAVLVCTEVIYEKY